MRKQTILLIDDERPLIEILSSHLQQEGFTVLSCFDGKEGIDQALLYLPDLVILDLKLPQLDGFQVCEQLRNNPETQQMRILILSALAEEMDQVIGFASGADDYVTKPFHMKPFIYRIKALLRRSSIINDLNGSAEDRISFHGLEIDRLNHICYVEDKELPLTPTEFRLLWTISRHPGRPFTRNELMNICRGEDANALARTIDVHIRSLRQKLSSYGNLIETIRGIGYRFRPQTEAVTSTN